LKKFTTGNSPAFMPWSGYEIVEFTYEIILIRVYRGEPALSVNIPQDRSTGKGPDDYNK
jgi:hypothetical protein